MRSGMARRGWRAVGLGLVVGGLVLGTRVVAAAPLAVPDVGHSTHIRALPFSDLASTAGAPAGDAQPLPTCTPFGARRAVWYRLSPDADITVAADTLDSSYDTVLAVYAWAGGALEMIACNDSAGLGPSGSLEASAVSFPAQAHTIYYLQVSAADHVGAPGAGGTLALHVSAA